MHEWRKWYDYKNLRGPMPPKNNVTLHICLSCKHVVIVGMSNSIACPDYSVCN